MKPSRRSFLGGAAALVLDEAFAKAADRGEPSSDPRMAYCVLDALGRPIPGLSRNEDKPMLIASLTKVMTGILVFDAIKSKLLSFDDVITVGPQAANEGGSDRYWNVKAGTKLAVHECLHWMGTVSHNGITMALAAEVARRRHPGTQDPIGDFVRDMNQKAANIGMPMPETQFQDVNGLHDRNRSTARGIAKMLQAGIKAHKAWYANYFGQTGYPENRTHRTTFVQENHYGVVHKSNIYAAKSGFTHQAGRCGAFAGERNGVEIYGAILHAPNGRPDGGPIRKPADFNAVREAETLWLAEQAYARSPARTAINVQRRRPR
jgi:D-alanyl-D-alanine carboxypeptidase (penicillin-binding protein 5/6)